MLYLTVSFPWFNSSATEVHITRILKGLQDRYGSMKALCIQYKRIIISRSMRLLGTRSANDIAHGRIYFMPPRFIKMIQETPTYEIIVGDGRILIWYQPEKKVAHEYPYEKTGKRLSIIMDIIYGFRNAQKDFKITIDNRQQNNGIVALKISPQIQWQDIEFIMATVDTRLYTVKSVELYDWGGNITKFELKDISQKKSLKEGFFKLSLPRDVRLIREEVN